MTGAEELRLFYPGRVADTLTGGLDLCSRFRLTPGLVQNLMPSERGIANERARPSVWKFPRTSSRGIEIFSVQNDGVQIMRNLWSRTNWSAPSDRALRPGNTRKEELRVTLYLRRDPRR